MSDEGAPFGRVNYDTQVNADNVVRTFEEEKGFVERVTPWKFKVKKNFVPGITTKVSPFLLCPYPSTTFIYQA